MLVELIEVDLFGFQVFIIKWVGYLEMIDVFYLIVGYFFVVVILCVQGDIEIYEMVNIGLLQDEQGE